MTDKVHTDLVTGEHVPRDHGHKGEEGDHLHSEKQESIHPRLQKTVPRRSVICGGEWEGFVMQRREGALTSTKGTPLEEKVT